MNKLSQRIEVGVGILVLTLLLLGCMVVLRPFLSSVLWAAVLCFSSWPIYIKLLALMKDRRTLAAGIMTLIMILVVLMPFVIVGFSMADDVKEFTSTTVKWMEEGTPAPPEWLARVPLVGAEATEYWKSISGDTAKLTQEAKRLVEPVSAGLVKLGILIGNGIVQLSLSIFIAFFLFRDGQSAAQWLSRTVKRIGGDRGRHLLHLAGHTVRGVVYGILGTAIVQAVMAGIGFIIAGVPGAGVLTLLTFFLSIVPMGPPLVWGPAAIWLYKHGFPGWAIFMAVWGIGVSSIDNVVKPWLISQGCSMPFVLIFFGVIGGALAFGFIGVFIGPTLLAVGYRLIREWAGMASAEGNTPNETSSSDLA